MENESTKESLLKEIYEVSKHLSDLKEFTQTEQHLTLPVNEQLLIKEQIYIMNRYKQTLSKRIGLKH